MLNDTRLRGEVNLDGELFGEVTNTGLGRPGINQSFVLFGVEGHNRLSEPEWRPFYQNVKREGMWGRELELLNAPQSTFSNVPLIVDVTGIRTTLPPESQATVGSLPGKRVLVILSRYLSASVFILRGNEGEGWLSGPSKKYPVVIVFLG
jgi:hypothetical protein